MKNTYTKKQISEAIAYWKNVLSESTKSDEYEKSCMPQIAKYIQQTFDCPEERIFIDTTGKMSPLVTPAEMKQIQTAYTTGFRTTGIGRFQKKSPTKEQAERYSQNRQLEAIVKLNEKIVKAVPNYEQYIWFIFHTGYMNSNSDILVARRMGRDDLFQNWRVQNIEIKRDASAYLFQPQLKTGIRMSDGTLEITGISHAYLDKFSQNTAKLQDMIVTAIQNDPHYSKAMEQIVNTTSTQEWLKTFLNGRKSATLMSGIVIPNVEDLVKAFYFDGYDMNRSVSIFQIGSGANARLFKVSNVKSTPQIDPLQLIPKSNAFSSAFNSIVLSIEVRRMSEHSKIKVYGKIRFSNKNASIVGSFDPNGVLPS